MITIGRETCGYEYCSGSIHVMQWTVGMECGWKNTSPRHWLSLKRRDFDTGFAYGMVMFFNCRKGKELYHDVQVPARA